MVEFEAVATRLEDRLDRLGISEKDLLDAAAKVRERILTEVYGLEVEELVQPLKGLLHRDGFSLQLS